MRKAPRTNQFVPARTKTNRCMMTSEPAEGNPTDNHSLVHFEGMWSEGERRRVQRAIEDVEARWTLDVPSSGEAWVCVCHLLPQKQERLYVAQRVNQPRILKARSAHHLAQRIRQCADPKRS